MTDMKHAGYGRYDVEVNGQVVGRAVKRPEGWEATGDMKGISVTVHGHDSLESACMAIGRALMGSQGAECAQLKARVAELENLSSSMFQWWYPYAYHSPCIERPAKTLASTYQKLIKRKPAQSLAEHDAALLEDKLHNINRQAYPKYEDEHGRGHYEGMILASHYLQNEASRIRKGDA